MTRQTWKRLKSDAASRLSAACPWLAGRPLELTAFSTLVAFSDVKLFSVALHGRIEAELRTVPSIGKDELARELAGMIAELAADHASSPRPASSPAFGNWVESMGLSFFSTLRQAVRIIAKILA